MTSPAFTSIGSDVRSLASSTSFCASSTEYFGCRVWLRDVDVNRSGRERDPVQPGDDVGGLDAEARMAGNRSELAPREGERGLDRPTRLPGEKLVDRCRRDRRHPPTTAGSTSESETYDQIHRKKPATGNPSSP